MNIQKCLQCGVVFEQEHINQLLCSPSCVKARVRSKQTKARKALEEKGLCRECWHSPVINGKKVCADCLQKNAKIRKAKGDADPRFYMFSNARHRSKVFRIPFDIDIKDIVIPEFCPILGIKLERGKDKKIQDSSPTLDKINPALGYVKGNVIVLSQKANRLKNNATLEEMILLGEWANKRIINNA